MQKILLCTLLFWLATFTSQAQINNLAPVWANVFSGSGTASGNKVTIDANGNIYTIGSFTGTVDFDPGVGVTNRTSSGGSDVFVVATNSAGGFLWIQVVANSGGNDIGTGIAVSPTNGDIYVCGLLILNSFDIFITRLTVASGAISATITIGAGNSDLPQSLCIDNQGNVIVVGAFENTVDFGGTAGILTCSSVLLGDTFILKLNANLVSTWVRGYGGDREDSTYGVVTDANNDIYFTSGFRSTSIAFGTITLNNFGGTNGELDIAVVKLSANGNNILWASRAGGIGQDRGLGIALGANGGLYCIGEFSNTANFGGTFFTSNGSLDAFISRLDPANGNFLWIKTFGGTGNDIPRRIILDNASNVLTVGNFVGTVDFDPNGGVQSLVGTGTNNGFISRLDLNGNFLSANQISSPNGSATTNGVALDATNRIHITGDFINTIRLNPSNSSLNNVTNTALAAYTAVYVPFVCAIAFTNTTAINGIANVNYTLNAGATGLSNLAYTISPALPTGLSINTTTGVISGISAVPVLSNTYAVTAAQGGCSATQNYTFAINCAVSNITPATIPNGIATVAYNEALSTNLTGVITWSVSPTLPAGISLSVSGVISGTSTVAVASAAYVVSATNGVCSTSQTYNLGFTTSCTLVVLNPNLLALPNATLGVPYSLTMTATGGIVGATYSYTTLTPMPEGLSFVNGLLSGTPRFSTSVTFLVKAVTPSGCEGTRVYTLVILPDPATAIDSSLSSLIKVYPNPSKDIFNIDLGNLNLGKSAINIYDMQGKIVYVSEINSNEKSISLDNMASGIYLIEINTMKGRVTKRIVKE